jgi:hypothetical protein
MASALSAVLVETKRHLPVESLKEQCHLSVPDRWWMEAIFHHTAKGTAKINDVFQSSLMFISNNLQILQVAEWPCGFDSRYPLHFSSRAGQQKIFKV